MTATEPYRGFAAGPGGGSDETALSAAGQADVRGNRAAGANAACLGSADTGPLPTRAFVAAPAEPCCSDAMASLTDALGAALGLGATPGAQHESYHQNTPACRA